MQLEIETGGTFDVSPAALSYLRSVDVDLGTLHAGPDGLIRGRRKSRPDEVNPIDLQTYASVVAPVPKASQEVLRPPEVLVVPSDPRGTWSLGVSSPGVPTGRVGPREVIHNHDLHVAFVPLIDAGEYAVLCLRDYFALREAGLGVRVFQVERAPRVGKKARQPLAVTTNSAKEKNGAQHRIAELLMLCGPDETVEFLDGNVGRLLRNNMRKVPRCITA